MSLAPRVVLIPRLDADYEPMAPMEMPPCAICWWNYDPKKERRGVYSEVAPLFYYPHGHHVCRWCMARPLVLRACREIRAAVAKIEGTLT